MTNHRHDNNCVLNFWVISTTSTNCWTFSKPWTCNEIFYHLGNFANPKFVFSMKCYRSATTDGKLNFGAKARIFSISSKLFFNMALYFQTFASTQAISFSDLSNILWHIKLTKNQNMTGYRKSNFTHHLRQLRSNRPETILFCWWTLARSPRRTQGESLLFSTATYLSNIANFFMMKFFVILPLIPVPLMINVRTRL